MKSVSLKTKLLFGAGDIYGGGAMNLINFFYLIFLTDVLNIRPVYAGAIFMCSKIWDAVSDPLMGVITDNTRSRFGRRRPYFLAGVIFVFLSFVLLWFPAGFAAETARVLFALAAYLLFCTVFTMVMVPYYAMSAELSSSYNERTQISNIRLAFSMGSSIFCALLPMMIVRAFADIRIGYICMSVVFGLFFALPFIGVFAGTKESPCPHERARFSWKAFVYPFKLRTFRILVLLYLMAFLSLDIISTQVSYYMKYYMMRGSLTNIVLGAVIIAQILFLPVHFALSKRIGKNGVYALGCGLTVAGVALMAAVSPLWPQFVMFIPPVIVGAGMSACVSMPWSMYGDVTDVGELAAGVRTEGSFSGIMTFVRKVSSALTVFLVSALIDFFGYVRPVEGVEQAQPEAVLLCIRLIILGAPLVLLSAGFFFALKYPLNRQTHDRLREFLSGGTKDKTVEAELKEKLI
jgi:oligogalacturonide transporter